MGSKPAFATYAYNILTAFQANDSTHNLFVASTTFGQSYPEATGHPNIHIGSAPALFGASLAGGNSTLYLAFQADDSSNDLFVASSTDGGLTWQMSGRFLS